MGLPVIALRTQDSTFRLSRHRWAVALVSVQTDSGMAVCDTVEIRGRGNATWHFAKKPFDMRLRHAAPLLGMPAGRRWALLANYRDRTQMRNAWTLYLGSLMPGLQWTPQCRFAWVELNDHPMGLYLVCQPVRPGRSRLPLHPPHRRDTVGQALTGDYLLCLDRRMDARQCFYSPQSHWPVEVHSPRHLSSAQMLYIQDYMGRVDRAMRTSDFGTLATLIDYPSFADYYIIMLLSGNPEVAAPRSLYCYKVRSGKLYAGPLWDFDYGTYGPALGQDWRATPLWYRWLMRDPQFVSLVSSRWMRVRRSMHAACGQWSTRVRGMEHARAMDQTLSPPDTTILPLYRNDDDALTAERAQQLMQQRFAQRVLAMDSVWMSRE